MVISYCYMSLNVVFSEEISTREIVDNVNDNVLFPILESPELTPSFSDIDIDINDSLIISYEDISTDDYECSINSEGITASIIEENGYLQCEVEAINNIEFGTM